MKSLSPFMAVHGVTLTAEHVPGKLNDAVDALSRGNLLVFCRQVPNAVTTPTAVPPILMELLVHSRPDWTSAAWRSLFNDMLHQV